MRKLLLLLAFLPLLTCERVSAAQFCVESAADLQAALDTSVANGQDDYIYMEATFNLLSAGLTFFSSEDHNLILVGGYDDGCNTRIGRTTLDGRNLYRPLHIATNNGNFLLQGFNVQFGHAAGPGGGLHFASTSGNASILLNRFTSNRSLVSAGGIHASSDEGIVFVYNNVVYANRANEVGGVVLDQAGDGRLINNTIYANVTDTPTAPGGVQLLGSGHFDVANNLVWANAPASGADFRADTSHGRRHNDIEIIAGSVTPDSVTGELSVDPQLAFCGVLCITFDLSATSPLIDAGSDAALLDLGPGLIDLRDVPRILGPHVDIGAYEFDGELFSDGFES